LWKFGSNLLFAQLVCKPSGQNRQSLCIKIGLLSNTAYFQLSSLIGLWMTSSLAIVRIVLVVLVIFPINIISIFFFQKYFGNKERTQPARALVRQALSSSRPNDAISQRGASASNTEYSTAHEASRNVTSMLISVSFLYVIGTIPYMLVEIIFLINAPVNELS
jgi:predicted membrane-bound mannosyltransferase